MKFFISFLAVLVVSASVQGQRDAFKKHKYGEPRQLFKFSGEGSNLDMSFEKDTLEELLMHEQVRLRRIVVLNIASAYKQDKNYLLDYCLRFLYANYKSLNNVNFDVEPKDWMDDQNKPTVGFSTKLDNSVGIKVWSDVFLHETSDGKEIAILVMDTKPIYSGLFEDEKIMNDNAKIFTLSFLLSSVQVLNVQEDIRDEELMFLRPAMKYAQYASKEMEDENQKSFQKFLFLIRYWRNPDTLDFGQEGGRKYLENILETDDVDQLKKTKNALKTSFEQLDCFLMPTPGSKVATSSNFNGSWSIIDKKYVALLEKLIPSLLAPENLTTKKFNGREFYGFEVLRAAVALATTFSTSKDKIPKSKKLYEATIETNLFVVTERVQLFYERNLALRGPSVRSNDDFEKLHEELKAAALRIKFESRNYFDKAEYDIYEYQMHWIIENLYKNWCVEKRNSCNKRKEVNKDDFIEPNKEDGVKIEL